MPVKNNMMGFYDFGLGYFGWMMMLVFWGGIIWLIVWLISQNRQPMPPAAERPLDILNARYSRGEISHEEYIRMKRDLTGSEGSDHISSSS